jgi:hypothetical protein
MSKPRLKRPSLGTVLGFTALIVAVVGTANAAPSQTIIRKGDIAKGAVTAKTLAPGAVHSKALFKGSVNANALADGSVTAQAIKQGAVTGGALGPNSVTASAISPGSVYGAALGPVEIHAVPIADADTVPHNGEWTASNTVKAECGTGERLLTGGIAFANAGNREVGVLASLPFTNSTTAGYVGQITSDSGGTAAAQVQAICLK